MSILLLCKSGTHHWEKNPVYLFYCGHSKAQQLGSIGGLKPLNMHPVLLSDYSGKTWEQHQVCAQDHQVCLIVRF